MPVSPTASMPGAIRTIHLPVRGALRDCVEAFVAVEMGPTGPLPLAIAPSDTLMLTVQLARGADAIGPKGSFGLNTRLTGVRRWTGRFVGTGDCVTLFAMLTPLGAVQLLESRRLDGGERIRMPLAHLLDDAPIRRMESDVALRDPLEGKLQAFAAWLEGRASAHRRQSRPALRAARAAMRLCADPRAALETLADEQHVSRRQLERDFDRWLDVSPRHLAQVARMQGVARDVHAGASLADAATGRGFADQPHMNRVVRQLTGLTPREFARSEASPFAAAFRAAAGGRTVYL